MISVITYKIAVNIKFAGKEVRYGKRFIHCLYRISESAEET